MLGCVWRVGGEGMTEMPGVIHETISFDRSAGKLKLHEGEEHNTQHHRPYKNSISKNIEASSRGARECRWTLGCRGAVSRSA